MAKRIALFNHKGGVSKTTTAFNLGWMLASKGQRVILVDSDPQCNLSGMVLGYRGPTEFEQFYRDRPHDNLRAGLSPAFESRPEPIRPVECLPVAGREGLFLLAGHIRLAEYEVTLGIAQELSGSIQTLQNLPGSISTLLNLTAEKYHADYTIVDMSPSLSSINQNLLTTSDYFVVPSNPDYFSVMAFDSLASVLPNWKAWAAKAQTLDILRQATYPFPSTTPKFLGTIVQKYRPRGGEPAAAFQRWIEEINQVAENRLVPVLRDNGMMLPESEYQRYAVTPAHCLATIPDFNSLIAISQRNQTPIYALSQAQIGQAGVVLERTLRSRDDFNRIFSDLADKIIGLTADAGGN